MDMDYSLSDTDKISIVTTKLNEIYHRTSKDRPDANHDFIEFLRNTPEVLLSSPIFTRSVARFTAFHSSTFPDLICRYDKETHFQDEIVNIISGSLNPIELAQILKKIEVSRDLSESKNVQDAIKKYCKDVAGWLKSIDESMISQWHKYASSLLNNQIIWRDTEIQKAMMEIFEHTIFLEHWMRVLPSIKRKDKISKVILARVNDLSEIIRAADPIDVSFLLSNPWIIQEDQIQEIVQKSINDVCKNLEVEKNLDRIFILFELDPSLTQDSRVIRASKALRYYLESALRGNKEHRGDLVPSWAFSALRFFPEFSMMSEIQNSLLKGIEKASGVLDDKRQKLQPFIDTLNQLPELLQDNEFQEQYASKLVESYNIENFLYIISQIDLLASGKSLGSELGRRLIESEDPIRFLRTVVGIPNLFLNPEVIDAILKLIKTHDKPWTVLFEIKSNDDIMKRDELANAIQEREDDILLALKQKTYGVAYDILGIQKLMENKEILHQYELRKNAIVEKIRKGHLELISLFEDFIPYLLKDENLTEVITNGISPYLKRRVVGSEYTSVPYVWQYEKNVFNTIESFISLNIPDFFDDTMVFDFIRDCILNSQLRHSWRIFALILNIKEMEDYLPKLVVAWMRNFPEIEDFILTYSLLESNDNLIMNQDVVDAMSHLKRKNYFKRFITEISP